MTQSVTELSLPTPKERRRLREAAELTHEEVAAAVGVTATTVRSWETGRTDPRGRKREAYAKLLTRLAATTGPASGTEPRAYAASDTSSDTSSDSAQGAPEPAAALSATPTRPAWANGTATPATATATATAPAVEAEAESEGGSGSEAESAALTGVSKEPEAVTGASESDTDEASAANSAEGYFGLLARAARPVGVPRHEAKATVKAAVGGGGLATLRAGGTIPHGPGTVPPGPGTGMGINSTGTGTGPGNDGPGDESGGTSTRTAPETAAQGAANGGTDERPPRKVPTPESAFDALYNRTAPALTRQAYLLTGRRGLAHEAVERAFQQAWGRWPEVATDPDPVGWVRAATYEYALSPWHQFRRAHKHPDKPPADPGDRALMDAMLALPPAHRRTLLLYDGVGLDLPDTAAETEASTPTAGSRLLNAHAELADRIPELADVAPGKQSALLRERLGALRPAVRLEPRSAAVVRAAGEGRTRRWTRAVLGLTVVIAAATAYTAATAPTEYEPPRAPGANVSGVPPHSGPQQLSDEGRQLHDKLLNDPAAGPARVSPKPE